MNNEDQKEFYDETKFSGDCNPKLAAMVQLDKRARTAPEKIAKFNALFATSTEEGMANKMRQLDKQQN